MLAWPPGWLLSLHTLRITPVLPFGCEGGAGGHACVLRAAHVAALAAAAPQLCVLDTTGVRAAGAVLAQLRTALPELQQCSVQEEAEEEAM